MINIADAAAPHGARVAERFQQTFAQVSSELNWGGMEKSFRQRYYEMYVKQRAFTRVLRLSQIVGHRWGWEKTEGPGFNQTCYCVASVLLLRAAPDHREQLLWQAAWAEVYLTDAWALLTKPAPRELARAR
jgi:hypothetical protein